MQVRKAFDGGGGGRASALRAAPSGTAPAASPHPPRAGNHPTVSSHLTNPPLKPANQPALRCLFYLTNRVLVGNVRHLAAMQARRIAEQEIAFAVQAVGAVLVNDHARILFKSHLECNASGEAAAVEPPISRCNNAPDQRRCLRPVRRAPARPCKSVFPFRSFPFLTSPRCTCCNELDSSCSHAAPSCE